jgi:hypothetical protein
MAYSLGENCDDTVVVAFAKPRGGGAHYIWACWWGKFTASDKTDLLLNAINTIRPETCFMQKDLGSENFQLNLTARAILPQFNLIKVPITWTELGNHTKDAKLKRIADMQLSMQGKRLYFAVSTINGVKEFQGTPGAYAKLCQQLLNFPGTGRDHDDFADTAAQVAAATSTGYLSEVLPSTRPARNWLRDLNNAEPPEDQYYDGGGGTNLCMTLAVTPSSRRTKTRLTNINYAVHEAGHIVGALSRNLRTDAAIGSIQTELGRAGAAMWHSEGTIADELFILACGIAASKQFGLGTAGLLKDLHDFDVLDADDAVKQRAQDEADLLIATNTDIVRKMAFALYRHGTLDEATTQAIFAGAIGIKPPKSFLAALEQIPKFYWALKS